MARMDQRAASAFARDWIRTWNANDLDHLMSHYRENVRFTSPRAQSLVGVGTIEGKSALREYWGKAIERTTDRVFELDHCIWDANRSELVVVYISRVDGRSLRACESFRFDVDGMVIQAEALYGATLPDGD